MCEQSRHLQDSWIVEISFIKTSKIPFRRPSTFFIFGLTMTRPICDLWGERGVLGFFFVCMFCFLKGPSNLYQCAFPLINLWNAIYITQIYKTFPCHDTVLSPQVCVVLPPVQHQTKSPSLLTHLCVIHQPINCTIKPSALCLLFSSLPIEIALW